jgi:hypothetical protein
MRKNAKEATKDKKSQRAGRRPLIADALLELEPYKTILAKMEAEQGRQERAGGGDGVTLEWLFKLGIEHPTGSGRVLGKSSISRYLLRLRNAGFVKKEKWRFSLTARLTDLLAMQKMMGWIKNADFSVLGPDRNTIVFGEVGKRIGFGEVLVKKLKPLTDWVRDETVKMVCQELKLRLTDAIRDLELGKSGKSYISRERSIHEKAALLLYAGEILGAELEQMGYSDKKLSELGLMDTVREIRDEKGLPLIKEKSHRRRVKAVTFKIERGRTRRPGREQIEGIIWKDLTPLLSALRSSPTFVAQVVPMEHL